MMAQSNDDFEWDSQPDRGSPDKTDPISEIPPSEMWILMRIQHVGGSPLPAWKW